jgi:hypothetical protein
MQQTCSPDPHDQAPLHLPLGAGRILFVVETGSLASSLLPQFLHYFFVWYKGDWGEKFFLPLS